jgi:hypothetical protein
MEPPAKPRLSKRIRFTCACCKRRRGSTRLGGFMGKLLPVCEECAIRLERERWNNKRED